MSVPLKSVDVITLFVEDLPRSRSFYQDVFGLPMVFEDANSAVFKFENTTVNLLKVPAAHGLIEPAAVASREAGSRFQFTIHVDDVDTACTQLAQRGVTLLNGPVNRPWGVRTASFTDPAGHIWEIAQELPQTHLGPRSALPDQRRNPCNSQNGAGCLFLVIGLLITTGYRGIARKFISLPSDSRRERTRHLRRMGGKVLRDERDFLDVGRRYDPDLILGAGFVTIGGLALFLGLVGLAIVLSR